VATLQAVFVCAAVLRFLPRRGKPLFRKEKIFVNGTVAITMAMLRKALAPN
jgi:hypothetical protein